MIINLLEQARAMMARFVLGENTIWHGQWGFACPQLGYVDFIWGHNRVVNSGLNQMLNAALRGEGIISAWYVAPFVNNLAPAANLTAATFNSTLTEFTNYTEATRPVWTSDAASTAQQLENVAVPATITVDSGAQTSIYGAGLLSVSGKGATSGTLFSAALAPSPFLNLAAGFEVKMKYRLTGTSS